VFGTLGLIIKPISTSYGGLKIRPKRGLDTKAKRALNEGFLSLPPANKPQKHPLKGLMGLWGA